MFLRFIAVFAIVGCSNLVSGQLDFSKCFEYQTKMKACLEQNNIIGTDETAVDTVLDFYSQNPSTCGVISQYKELVTCVVDVRLNCLEGDYKTLYASAEQYSSALTYFCSRIGTFDSACFWGSVAELGNCISDNKATLFKEGAGFEEFKTSYCARLNTGIDCFTKNTKLSSCEDTRTTLIELYKITKPPTCGTMRVVSHTVLVTDTRTTLIEVSKMTTPPIEVSKMTTPPASGTMRVVSHILLLILSVVFSKYVCY